MNVRSAKPFSLLPQGARSVTRGTTPRLCSRTLAGRGQARPRTCVLCFFLVVRRYGNMLAHREHRVLTRMQLTTPRAFPGPDLVASKLPGWMQQSLVTVQVQNQRSIPLRFARWWWGCLTTECRLWSLAGVVRGGVREAGEILPGARGGGGCCSGGGSGTGQQWGGAVSDEMMAANATLLRPRRLPASVGDWDRRGCRQQAGQQPCCWAASYHRNPSPFFLFCQRRRRRREGKKWCVGRRSSSIGQPRACCSSELLADSPLLSPCWLLVVNTVARRWRSRHGCRLGRLLLLLLLPRRGGPCRLPRARPPRSRVRPCPSPTSPGVPQRHCHRREVLRDLQGAHDTKGGSNNSVAALLSVTGRPCTRSSQSTLNTQRHPMRASGRRACGGNWPTVSFSDFAIPLSHWRLSIGSSGVDDASVIDLISSNCSSILRLKGRASPRTWLMHCWTTGRLNSGSNRQASGSAFFRSRGRRGRKSGRGCRASMHVSVCIESVCARRGGRSGVLCTCGLPSRCVLGNGDAAREHASAAGQISTVFLICGVRHARLRTLRLCAAGRSS